MLGNDPISFIIHVILHSPLFWSRKKRIFNIQNMISIFFSVSKMFLLMFGCLSQTELFMNTLSKKKWASPYLLLSCVVFISDFMVIWWSEYRLLLALVAVYPIPVHIQCQSEQLVTEMYLIACLMHILLLFPFNIPQTSSLPFEGHLVNFAKWTLSNMPARNKMIQNKTWVYHFCYESKSKVYNRNILVFNLLIGPSNWHLLARWWMTSGFLDLEAVVMIYFLKNS